MGRGNDRAGGGGGVLSLPQRVPQVDGVDLVSELPVMFTLDCEFQKAVLKLLSRDDPVSTRGHEHGQQSDGSHN